MSNSLPTRLFLLLLWSALVVAPATAQESGPDDWDVTEPRGEPREVDFTTEEGTWLSVDVSPDGESLVFDLRGHIYQLPIEGGEAQVLTQESGLATNFHPSYSPSGDQIAFVSDRGGTQDLWVMDADGSDPTPVAASPDWKPRMPTWTADGEYIIVKKQEVEEYSASGLWMYASEGQGDGIDLVTDEDLGATWPSVSSDGQHLYFQASLRSGNALEGDFQLRRYDFETGDIIDVTAGNGYAPASRRLSSGGAMAPEVSPDGETVAFGRMLLDGTISYEGHEYGPRTALWLRDVDTGAEEKVMDPIANADEGGGEKSILPGYSWTPDGTSIVLNQGGKLRRLDVEKGEVETIPFEARVQRTISERAYNDIQIEEGPFQPQFLRWHTKSPDGSALAFQAVGQIWVMDLPDGTPRRLTPDSFDYTEFAPAWSPDGKRIAFTTLDEENHGDVWTVPASGGSPTKISTQKIFYTHPVWSPDGESVVVTRGGGATNRGRTVTHNAHFDLVRIPSEGGPAEQVAKVAPPTGTDLGEYARRAITQASFGPDGRLFFPDPMEAPEETDDDVDQVMGLVSVSQDGTDRRVHMTFPYADEIVPSPDGRHVAFQEGDNVYLTQFPYGKTGDETIHINKQNPALPVEQLTHEGGLFPKWKDRSTLEFGSANHHFTYDVQAEEKDTTEIDFTVSKDVPEGTVAFTGARILTMDDREVIDEGTLVISGGRIQCVGPSGACAPSAADRVIDAAGKTILPGLIDMHAHHYREHRGHRPRYDYELAGYLAYGVTTNLDNSMWAQNIFPTAERVEAGRMIGPRTFSTGDPLYQGDGARHNKITSYETAAQNVRRLKSWGAVSIKQYSHPRRYQRQWIIDAAREEGLTVTGHWYSNLIMDGQTAWEHEFPYHPMYEDYAAFYGQADAVYSPTWVVGGNGPSNIEKFFADTNLWQRPKQQTWMPWRMLTFSRRRPIAPETDYTYPLTSQQVADVLAEGGHAAIGGHGEHHPLAPHWEIWMASEALGEMGALEIATRGGAYFLGAEEELGSIEEGKIGDVVVLNSNPLDDIRNTLDIQYVVQWGRVYEGDSLDEVWPTSSPFGEKYWVDDGAFMDDTRPIGEPQQQEE